MPRLSEEDRKSFGRFSKDYDVIVTFNDTLTDAMGTKLPEVMRRGNSQYSTGSGSRLRHIYPVATERHGAHAAPMRCRRAGVGLRPRV